MRDYADEINKLVKELTNNVYDCAYDRGKEEGYNSCIERNEDKFDMVSSLKSSGLLEELNRVYLIPSAVLDEHEALDQIMYTYKKFRSLQNRNGVRLRNDKRRS